MAFCRVATTDAVGLQTKGLTQAELDQIVFSNKLGKEKGHESFWSDISESISFAACNVANVSQLPRFNSVLSLRCITMFDGRGIHSPTKGLGPRLRTTY